MKKIITVALIITYSLFLQVNLYAFSLNVEPTKLFFKGSNETKTITIRNNGKENISISVYLRDWEYKGKSKIFMDTGKSKFSLYKWVSISPSSLVLKPGEEKEVNITMKPDNAPNGGYVGVVFFEGVIGAKDKGRVVISGRIGTLVFLETKNGIEKKGNIAQFKTMETKSKKLDISLVFFNEGNTHLYLNGNVIITDFQGNIVDKIKFQDWGALPGLPSELNKRFSKDFLPGNYLIVATIDLGTDKPVVLERNITIK